MKTEDKKKMKPETGMATMNHASVSNNINLNISQADLVELIIEEKIQGLRTERKELTKHIAELETERQKAVREIYREVISRNTEEVTAYMKVVNALLVYSRAGKKASLHNETIRLYFHEDTPVADSCKEWTYYYQNIDHCKRTPDHGTNGTSVYYTTKAYLQSNISKQPVITSHPEQLSQADINAVIKVNTEYLEASVKIKNDLFKVEKEMCKYIFQEKSIRAQLTKLALNKTTEGKHILEELKKVTGLIDQK